MAIMYDEDSMELTNEFTVAASTAEAWELLMDLERVAGCLPGATIDGTDPDGQLRGGMRIKLGPIQVAYAGTAQLTEVDEDDLTATLVARAHEKGGQGTAAATITNRLEPVDGGTRIVAQTTLDVTGRQAQFGRGIMQDVADRMLGEFAVRFERELQGPKASGGSSVNAAAPAAADDDDVLDLGNAVLGTFTSPRFVVPAAGLLVACVLAVLAFVLCRQARRPAASSPSGGGPR